MGNPKNQKVANVKTSCGAIRIRMLFLWQGIVCRKRIIQISFYCVDILGAERNLEKLTQ